MSSTSPVVIGPAKLWPKMGEVQFLNVNQVFQVEVQMLNCFGDLRIARFVLNRFK